MTVATCPDVAGRDIRFDEVPANAAKTVWKYAIFVGAVDYPVPMPRGARVVHVACQGDDASIVNFWAEVDPEATRETRYFQVFGTGQPIPKSYSHVGTALPVPELVWHLYEWTG